MAQTQPTHLVNPRNLLPVWRHHTTKPVFVSNIGLITSEPKYRDAANYHNPTQYTIEQLTAFPPTELPQPQIDHQPKTLAPYLNTARRNFWYITIPFHKKTYAIHSLVAETFLTQPTPDKKYICFIDNNKSNCTAMNLEYVARKELAQRSPSRHPASHPVDILRPDMSLYGSYPTLSDAAKALNVTLSRISEAYNGVRPSVHGYTIIAREEGAPIPPPYAEQNPQHQPQPQDPQAIPDYSGLEGEY